MVVGEETNELKGNATAMNELRKLIISKVPPTCTSNVDLHVLDTLTDSNNGFLSLLGIVSLATLYIHIISHP